MTGVPELRISRDGAWFALHDAATTPDQLAQIAAAYPEYATQIMRHPNAYPELISWARVNQTAPPDDGDAVSGRAQLRYPGLWVAQLVVVLAAPLPGYYSAYIDPGNPASRSLALLGVLPALMLVIVSAVAAPSVGRKIGAAVLALSAAIAFGGVVSAGGAFGIVPTLFGVLIFLSWAVARPLRGAGYAAIPVFVVATVLLSLVEAQAYFFWIIEREFGPAMLLLAAFLVRVELVPVLVIVLARSWSRVSERRRARRQRVNSVAGTAWGVARTNTFAVLSLVFAFVFSILGVIFGHVALTQIARTGESGRGLAVAGLVIGYVSCAIGIVTIVFSLVSMASALSSASSY